MRSTAQIKPLRQEQRPSADQWVDCPDQQYRYGIWLPTEDKPGVAQVDNWRGRYIASNANLHLHVAGLAGAYHYSPLRNLLGHLGLHAYTDSRHDGQDDSVLGFFPSVQNLQARVAEANDQLAPQHQLPEFIPFEGGEYPARTFLEALANGKVMIATGRDPAGEDEYAAWSAAHDMSFHVPFWLATPPRLRQSLSYEAEIALDTTPPNAPDNPYFPKLPTNQLMQRIDLGVSLLGIGGVVFERRSGGVRDVAELFATDYDEAWRLTKEIQEQVGHLEQHIPEFRPVDNNS